MQNTSYLLSQYEKKIGTEIMIKLHFLLQKIKKNSWFKTRQLCLNVHSDSQLFFRLYLLFPLLNSRCPSPPGHLQSWSQELLGENKKQRNYSLTAVNFSHYACLDYKEEADLHSSLCSMSKTCLNICVKNVRTVCFC